MKQTNKQTNKQILLRKLHIGCGSVVLNGWINIDCVKKKGVDLVLDVREGLPFRDGDVRFIFAEHFIEHLAKEEGLAFLFDCYRVLEDEQGVLRLSTPNLDWVWKTHYVLPAGPHQKIHNTEKINQAFYEWGHRFLYSIPYLESVLKKAGFPHTRLFSYGESDVEDLLDLEHHDRDLDIEELPHVIIIQAYKNPLQGQRREISRPLEE